MNQSASSWLVSKSCTSFQPTGSATRSLHYRSLHKFYLRFRRLNQCRRDHTQLILTWRETFKYLLPEFGPSHCVVTIKREFSEVDTGYVP
jgi:hypothetical protein